MTMVVGMGSTLINVISMNDSVSSKLIFNVAIWIYYIYKEVPKALISLEH